MAGQGPFALRYSGDIPVVDAAGDLDLTNVGEFEAVLALAAGADRGSVIVSLGRATYFDSQGIHVLLRFAEHLAITRQRLVMVAPHGTLPRRILEIAGLAQAFPVFETLDEAIAACNTSGKPTISEPGEARK